MSEFISQPLLCRERNSGAFCAFQSAVSQLGYPIEPAWESSSQEALLEATYLGLGVTILPEKLAKKEVSKNQLAQIHISDFSFQNTVCLAYHKNKFISPAMQNFINLVFSIK
ncbi:MAG: substrate-binding domain-containing protein [Eubacteriales bacterium]